MFKYLFISLIALTVLMVAMYVYLTLCFYHESRALKPASAPDMPRFLDLAWIPFISGILCHLFKKLVIKSTYNYVTPLCKNQNEPILLANRNYKAANYIYKFIYYFSGTIWGYFIFKDTKVFPHLLGGPNATGENFWEDQPYARTIEGALTFSLVTMGYHLEELVDHVII